MNLKIYYLKIRVSCEASVKFHHISQNATPATEFAPCRHLTQPWQRDWQKTRNTTRLKCCACHAKSRWRSPKCCACHEKCKASSEKDAKVLRLPHRTILDKLWNLLECHIVTRLPRERKLGTAIRASRGRLQLPDPQSETGTLATHSGTKRPTESPCKSSPSTLLRKDLMRPWVIISTLGWSGDVGPKAVPRSLWFVVDLEASYNGDHTSTNHPKLKHFGTNWNPWFWNSFQATPNHTSLVFLGL